MSNYGEIIDPPLTFPIKRAMMHESLMVNGQQSKFLCLIVPGHLGTAVSATTEVY